MLQIYFIRCLEEIDEAFNTFSILSAISSRFVRNVLVQPLKIMNVNVNKIQALKYGEYGDPKYTSTYTKRRKITQCHTQTCLRSNNAETNSFFAPFLNPIKFCD